MKEKIYIENTAKIGDWKEVKGIKQSEITNNDADTAILDGMLVYGYEMRWEGVNENGQTYAPNAFDKFIDEYFIANGLNMKVTVEHSQLVDDLAGRVIYLERNDKGIYFVAYIPRTYVNYVRERNLLREGILQGFSKEGWATDYSFDENGVMIINEMKMSAVSIVSSPANRMKFETVNETGKLENSMTFKVKSSEKEDKKEGLFDELFT